MDDFFILLALFVVLIVALGPTGFILALNARSRLRAAEARIQQLERLWATGPAQTAAPAPVEPPLPDASAPAPSAEAPASALAPAAPSPPKPRRSVEETLGTRWTVWVGGVALALGALLMVRYSIESGLLGPRVRVAAALAFAAALIAAGEWLRRRGGPQPRGAYIPGVLTGAGAVAAFGGFYAAHALYGLLGAPATFIALGVTGLACLVAAALHGPGLAAVGLIGSLAAPLLVSSGAPDPWPVVLYTPVVTAAAYALARLRRWLWLALAAGSGGALWTLVLVFDFPTATVVHAVAQTALAVFFLAVLAYRGVPDDAPFDRPSLLVTSILAALGLAALGYMPVSTTSVVCLTLLSATPAVAGLLRAPATLLVVVSALIIVAADVVWPGQAGEPVSFLWGQGLAILPQHPQAPRTLLTWSAAASILLALTTTLRLWRLPPTPARVGWALAGAAGATPLAALGIAYLRFHRGDAGFAVAATTFGVLAVLAATLFCQRLGNPDPRESDRIGLGAAACAAIAALALASTFATGGTSLIVAWSLAALGAAFVSVRLGIPALRWCAAALGLVVAARLAWEPNLPLVLRATPIVNGLLLAYGLPALAFGLAARMMRRALGEDTPVRIAQALAILLGGFLVFLEIRHGLNGGDIYADRFGLVETGLSAFASFGFAAVLTRLDARARALIPRVFSWVYAALSIVTSVIGLGLVDNPLWSGEPVAGGPVINALLLAYAMPALAGFVLARWAEQVRPPWYVQTLRGVATALIFAFLTLEVRRLFQGPDLDVDRATSQGEWYAYSAAWLLFGLSLLAIGLWRGSRGLRLASAFFVVLAVAKVFLFDMAGLEGLLRAASFIGLGLVLIGIGLIYQRLVFTPRPTVSS